jgi:hypothetical protein
MGKEVNWLHAPCVVLILKYLTITPRIPMQLRTLTKIKGNYVNILLKKLETEEIVRCLTPKEKIGKVFCINPVSRDLVEKVLKHSGYNLKTRHLPDLNWKAYGRLNCSMCRQMKKIFHAALALRNLGMAITVKNLKNKLREANGKLEIARSDIYRALRKLKKMGLMISVKKEHGRLEHELTKDALVLNDFMKSD